MIAPLTTTALNSVSGRHSGLASGVNNAVSRTASLLAVAVMGVLVFAAFSAALDTRLARMDLSPTERTAMEREKPDLGAAEAPEGVPARTARQVEGAVDEAFLSGFRLAMYLAAGLALLSALSAALIIEGKGRAAPVEGRASPVYEG